MKKIGLDIGAYSIKLVVIDEVGDVLVRECRPHHNKVKAVLNEMYQTYLSPLALLEPNVPVPFGSVAVTGSMSHLAGLENALVFEQAAMIEGAKLVAKEAGSVIMLGAQRTYYINARNSYEIKKNNNCSAGTGAFFEEQATRLQIPLENISETVKNATSIPNIAGRCSVFSKTDMIHRMQEGNTTPDILNGLCYALVRNYKSNILSNKTVEKPVYLAGGVMANTGVVEAIKSVVGLADGEYILDENADYLLAIGAANKATATMSLEDIINALKNENHELKKSAYEPLSKFVDAADKKDFILAEYEPGAPAYLGIDIGSTSTNFVVLNENRQMVYYSYVKTLGKPLDIVHAEQEKLNQAIPNLKLAGIAVTGSGREYIGKEIGATLVINEITAQTEGALMSDRGTETIFEIGGQDSKYMAVRDGKMVDFEMNKVCAAGTGAFLEEQIKKLGISMAEFMELAMKAKNPCELGDRCTVFIEGSINKCLAEGNELQDVCAGLAYAIVSNYLHRVVNMKKIGQSIALQGGIAYNEAVVCAFRALTGKEVHVTNYFSVTGALGAASLSMNKAALSFDKEKNQRINAKLLAATDDSYFKDYKAPAKDSKKKRVGIPRVLFMHKMFPLFNVIFTKLGFDVIISPLTNKDIVEKANEYVNAQTCYPVKLIYGHMAWLLEQDVDYIIMPRMYTVKHEGSVARHDYSCMYMQTSPLLMRQAFDFEARGVKLIMPELSLQFGKKYMVKSLLSIGKDIGVPKPLMLMAAIQGFKSLQSHSDRLEKIGKEALEGDEPIFVLVSRVYNIIDPVLNMGIEKHLNDIGCRVVHLEHLEASYMRVEHDYKDMYWPFGQHILTGLKLIKQNKNLYPIYITNHSCGPDTAIQHFLQNELDGREYLQIEVDEHASKVGVITRLEAFLYSLQPQQAVPMEKPQPKEKKADYSLIPDLGIYTDVLEKYLPSGHAPICRVKPLAHHVPVNYAMNKEYHTLLLMLEEVLATVEKDKVYDFYAPIDEGSEVFGQYALLINQELLKQGYQINYKRFYIEDIVRRDDYENIYADMLAAEQSNYAEKADIMLIGEPMCIYKPAAGNKHCIGEYNTMPFSEALLMHMRMVDRNGLLKDRLANWKKQHDAVMKQNSGTKLYSDITKMECLCRGKLDFAVGNYAKYRFAKLLSLDRANTSRAVILNSAEENVAIILKRLTEAYSKDISVPYVQLDIDFEHEINQEDLAI